MGREFEFGCVLVFFSRKVRYQKNHRNGSSEISFQSPFIRESNDIEKFSNFFPSVEKNQFEIFDFSSNFEQVK